MFWFLLFLVGCTEARKFNNPLIPGFDGPDPGVVYYKGLYYAATTGGGEQKFPIHTSPDVQNWTLATYIFNEDNRPVWSTNVEYWAPEIHVLADNQIRIYYTTRDAETKRLAIGAAFSTGILGPFHSLDRPLVLDTTQDILDATLINDNGRLYLIWKGSEWMYLREMLSDGLGFAPESETHLILRNDLEWEWYIIEGPWVVTRNDSFYLFYSGSEYCGDKYSVGVARSKSVFGPWEKKGDPILVSNDIYKGPGHCSVVKDVDQNSYVMIYHGYEAGEVCTPYPRLMWAQTVEWGDDGWPYMNPN